MWHWMAFHGAVMTVSWLAWPVVVANAPLTWWRMWAPPGRNPAPRATERAATPR